MQVLAPKPGIEETLSSVAEPNAQISLRAVAGLEVASVVASVFISVWVIIPLQPQQRWLMAIPGLLALALVVHSHKLRGERFSEIGFSLQYFGQALRLLALPTLLACGVFAGIGYSAGSIHKTSHFLTSVLVLPVWAITQQYVLQAFIYRRMRIVFSRDSIAPHKQSGLAILATAGIFSLVHTPNLTLMVLTLLGGLLWCWVYERAPNLWALGLSHAVISLMLMTSLPPWLLQSMSVGYKHFLYQKF